MPDVTCTVIKVGGSLFDWPDLGPRLRALVKSFDSQRIIVFPGGGAGADAVRELDRMHGLGEERSHWLALRALTVNAYFLQALLPGASVASAPGPRSVTILEPEAFARTDEENPRHLPHTWQVTSDSLAARAAVVFGVRDLLLLKSVACENGKSWHEAARAGLVDEYFPTVLRDAPRLGVRVLNLRAYDSRKFTS